VQPSELALADRLGDLRSRPVLLDVREGDEWRTGHRSGALHIPMDQVADRFGELDHGRLVVVVCRSGNRSDTVAEWLRGQGIDAENLEGGLKAWEAADLPLTAEDGSPGRVA